MISGSIVSLLFLALMLGLRHGIDWDHIAVISDITGTSQDKKKGFILGFLYSLGHAFVVVTIGLVFIVIGIRLPQWIDSIMQPIVGSTLIALGIWLILSIIRDGGNYSKKSRWMILFQIINKFSDYLHDRYAHKHNLPHIHFPETYGKRTAFSVGMLHGIGAETPTQALLFVTAAGVKGGMTGILLLFIFVTGLIISNTLITGLSSVGFINAQKNSRLNILIGLLTAIFSLIVGFLFLFNRSSVLPALFGG